MLLSIQFPFADLREFLDDTGKLISPIWPLPTPDKEFVRHFGSIRIRKLGGIEGWIGENEICEANRALKFCRNLSFVESGLDININLRCAFRRLYFDGLAVGKYEIGITPKKKLRKKLSKEQFNRLIEHILSLPIKISTQEDKIYKLIYASKPLTRMYLGSTTKNGYSNSVQDWWAIGGTPLLFLEYESEDISFPYWMKPITISKDYGFQLIHCLVPFSGLNLRMWILQHPPGLSQSRALRISLMRLFAEHECLRLVLRNIMNQNISVVPRSPRSDKLQMYFNNATSRINKLENSSNKQYDPEIVNLARQSINTISPSQRDSLLVTLENLDIRNNIFRNLKQYTDKWSDKTVMEVQHMGDNNFFINGPVSGSAIGPNATVFNQKWAKIDSEIDLPTLAKELAILRANLKKVASDPSHDISIGSVAAAETEAQRGNGGKVLEYLHKAGKWAFDTAVKIGVTVAAAALKEALNIK